MYRLPVFKPGSVIFYLSGLIKGFYPLHVCPDIVLFYMYETFCPFACMKNFIFLHAGLKYLDSEDVEVDRTFSIRFIASDPNAIILCQFFEKRCLWWVNKSSLPLSPFSILSADCQLTFESYWYNIGAISTWHCRKFYSVLTARWPTAALFSHIFYAQFDLAHYLHTCMFSDLWLTSGGWLWLTLKTSSFHPNEIWNFSAKLPKVHVVLPSYTSL